VGPSLWLARAFMVNKIFTGEPSAQPVAPNFTSAFFTFEWLCLFENKISFGKSLKILGKLLIANAYLQFLFYRGL
jgi:hypothetical protein